MSPSAEWTTHEVWVAYRQEHEQAHVKRALPAKAEPHRQACRRLAREIERREGATA